MSRAASDVTSVAVVIVTHDTRDDVLRCLTSLRSSAATDVVVADAGSTDGTVPAVRRAWPQARILELENTGFGRAANAGIRATDAPVVVVCNADVRFDPGAVGALAHAFTADACLGAVGPAVRYPDGTRQASARRAPDPTTALGHALLGRVLPGNRWTRRYHDTDADPSLPREVAWLSGCALALRRTALEDVGGFDPGYFLFMEDVELADRLRARGWGLRFDPTARVEHRVGASTRAHRFRALLAHARSLDRYLAQRGRGPLAGVGRPVVRLGLAGWVVLTYLVERAARLVTDARSTTGERRNVPPGGGQR